MEPYLDLKAGDTVKIRSDLNIGIPSKSGITDNMVKLAGKETTIKEITDSNCYILEIDGGSCVWNTIMFDTMTKATKPRRKKIKLNVELGTTAAWSDLHSKLSNFASLIEDLQRFKCDSIKNYIQALKEQIEITANQKNREVIKQLEKQATELVKEAIYDRNLEIERLKSKINSAILFPDIGDSFAKHNLFLIKDSDRQILVIRKATIIINKVFLGSYSKQLSHKHRQQGYIVAEFCFQEDGQKVIEQFIFWDTEFKVANTFHTSSSICTGDLKNEVMNINFDAEEISTAFDKLLKMLQYINVDSMFSSWRSNPKIQTTWKEAEEYLVNYFEKNDSDRICPDCESLTDENGECVMGCSGN